MLEYSVKSGTPEKQRSGCLIVAVFEGRKLSPAARLIDQTADGALASLLRRGDLEGRQGQTLLVHSLPNIPAERVLLIGAGKEKDLNEGRFRELCTKAVGILKGLGASEAMSYLTELDIKGRDMVWKVRQTVEVTEAALYRFDQMKSKPAENKVRLKRLTLSVPRRSDLAPGEQAIHEGLAIAAGVQLARDLGNLPGNVCTPTYLADRARKLGEEKNILVNVHDEHELKELGMGS